MKHQINIKDGKGVFYFSGILDTFIDGFIETMDKDIRENTKEMLYLVQTSKKRYILRVVACNVDSKKEIEEVLTGYKYSVDCSKKLPTIVATPLDIKEHINNDVMNIEMLYDYGETENPNNFGKYNADKLLSFAIKILEPLCKLEENEIFNLNINYTNILIDGDQVKVLLLRKTGTASSFKGEYSVLDSKNDVYCFGTMLYQLATGEIFNGELLSKELEGFLEQKIENKDLKCLIPILKKSLDSNPEKRPTFDGLKILLESIITKNELNKCKKELAESKQEFSNLHKK